MKARWIGGNEARLLENGEDYYPRVLRAIASARRQVLIETFILFEDKVGNELRRVLVEAGRRGVQIDLTVDGYGSSDLSAAFLSAITEAGARVHLFDPRPKIFGFRRNLFRRMHRKIVVVDGELAFVGGINFSADHLADFGPTAKQDYAVEVRGPIVGTIHRFTLLMLPRERRRTLREALGEWLERRREPECGPPPEGSALAAFVVRDNLAHRNDIEHQYRLAFRAARSYVCLANAYFFPGYRLLRDLRRAARRGVRVDLILQGEPDMPIVRIAARMLYAHLLRAGVRIHEYCERPLHGKVAVVDDEWATVGSSNLDPLSLSLNLEANLMLRDRAFAVDLRERLGRLIAGHCRAMEPGIARNSGLWRFVPGFVVFHVLRRFPKWATWLPAHEPQLKTIGLRPDDRGKELAEAAPRDGADRVDEQGCVRDGASPGNADRALSATGRLR